MARVGDEDLATAAGTPIAFEDPRSRLSRRELEVYQLLRRGLTNRQIATALFIAESTAKVHTHRIFDKLGVRSRNAIAVQALLEEHSYATSAIEGVTPADES
jgi:DNA-binding NarL/FixJ family response regulator